MDSTQLWMNESRNHGRSKINKTMASCTAPPKKTCSNMYKIRGYLAK